MSGNIIPFPINSLNLAEVDVDLDLMDFFRMALTIICRASEGHAEYKEVCNELTIQGPILDAKILDGEEYYRLRDDKLEHVVGVLYDYGFIVFDEEKRVIRDGGLL